jgi:hypothetical protein
VGAAIAISLGAGGIGITHATTSSGEKPIYLPMEPCRIADLRPAPFQVGPRSAPLGPNETYNLSGWGAVGDCTLPTGTTGLALNVTAVGATQDTFLTFFPAGTTRPNASNLNPAPGQPPTPNAVNIDLNGAGQFSVYNLQGNVNVIIDVVGVYDDHNHDDRYYTEAEADAAVKSIASFGENLTSVNIGNLAIGTVMVSATIDVAAAGTIVATGSTSLTESNGAENGCGLRPDTTYENSTSSFWEPPIESNLNSTTTVVRHFSVTAGSHTISLICRNFGTGSTGSRNYVSLVFVPD